MDFPDFQRKMNDWTDSQSPFIFVIDYEMKRPAIWQLDQLNPEEVRFNFNGISNYADAATSREVIMTSEPCSWTDYEAAFSTVINALSYGDTFLANLTMRTKVNLNIPLKDLYSLVKARYKMWWKDHFLFFSPESFVQIRGREISTFPMKGTIRADVPDAEQKLLDDRKEFAEHVTIVDLLRNDLSMIADDVAVRRFRYIDRLKTHKGDLLQVSSEISGTLRDEYHADVCSALFALLPAGSICGAPKHTTLRAIREAEKRDRGYYTGICGVFDGRNLDTGVMIRFIEESEGGLYYRSGGGITTQSDGHSEYQEMIDKVYVPID